MSKRKYTFEILSPIVESSISFAEVLKKLGLKQTGGSQSNIKKLVLEYRINIDHFLGQARNQSDKYRGGSKKISADEILILRDPLSHPEKAFKLRRALIEIGVSYCCELCGIGDLWNEKPLRLTIDHINGQRYDNRRENLRFLCPNCHSQTLTFGKSLGLTDITTCKRRDKFYREKRKKLLLENKV